MEDMINWKKFEAKFDKYEQWAFEQMSYFLFCSEMDNHVGVFRYKNQAGIETEPIEKKGIFYGFQAKYYTNSISQNKADIIDSLQKAKTKSTQLNKILLYINRDISESSNKEQKKPKYQTDIETAAHSLDIKIKWRVKSHFEFQLLQPKNTWIFDIFFGDNGLAPDFFEMQIEKEIKNLGPRFNEKLNFELPIAQIFNSISNNNIYHQNIISITDKWLTEKGYRKLKNNELLSKIETELEVLRQEIKNWIIEFYKFSVDTKITLLSLVEKVKVFNKKVSDKWNEIYDLSTKHPNKKSKPKKSHDSELRRLREIQDANRNFIENINDLNINVANHPTLIIQGEAGCGKSHLLGDIATQRKNQSLPTVLLLGTTFNNSNTIEKNILNKLDLTCSFNDFLRNLNNIGIHINSRVLILIDAINEGAGADLWKNQIAGFINDVAKYTAVGLVLTIRSTYYNDIIPEHFKSDTKINIITHSGFRGNEYEALKLFCQFHGLKLPSFPILNPEYSNPLFLHLICEAVKKLPEKSFPKGINGINKTYNLYKATLNSKFEEKRHEYKNREIVSCAIEKFANAIFITEYGQLECKDAVSLFDKEFTQFPHLLSDLIEECVFIKMRYEHGQSPKEYISFSYQKLGDFFMAEELLNQYSTKKEIINAFNNDTKFIKISKEYQWSFKGIVEAFSILLPERYGFELFELINFFYDKNADKKLKKWLITNTSESFTRILLNSLKWREISSINEKKITKWLENQVILGYEEWLFTLTELSAIPNHPFNSDRLFKILIKRSMPERDSFLQNYIRWYSGYDDNKIAFPLQRLIDWAWIPNISFIVDGETTRLVAQTLTWVLSSTDIVLRDKTTKALVNLLEQQPKVLIQTLTAFQNVDDMYILERLYAVAYGCILRTEKYDSIKKIAQYIFNTNFKNGNPPIHILIRDYARNAIEYAIFKNVGLDIDENLIRPPYNSEMPQIPTEEEINNFKLDHDSPKFEQSYGRQQNQIIYSVTSSLNNFHKHEISIKLDHFYPISFKTEQHYKVYLKSLNAKQRSTIKLFDTLYNLKESINERKNNYAYRILNKDNAELNHFIELVDKGIEKCNETIDELFSSDEQKYLLDEILPFLKEKNKPQLRKHFNTKPIERWIIQKVFNLGYNKDIHGEYDSMAERWAGYGYEYKIRRIGEKYQWIAWYEILARLTDNYKMSDGWDSKYTFYKGAWTNYLRDIDPAYITRKNDEDDDDEISFKNNVKNWWNDVEYKCWDYPDSEWVKTIDDLIDPKQVIEKIDINGENWLHLQHFVEWNEPKKIGIDRYEGRRKYICYIIQGLLVKKTDKQKIINYLGNRNFFNRWLPENTDDHSELINREKFWSPAYTDIYKNNRKTWETIRDTKYKVIVATESANGGIEDDKSGANRSYNIPCKYIFEKMKLHYAPIDGNLKNVDGEVIVINSNPKGVLIRKKDLIKFLEENKLDIIWTLLGEKYSFIDMRNEESYYKVPCGIYYLECGLIKGEINMYDRG